MDTYEYAGVTSILLIDDDEVVNFMNRLLLNNLGFTGNLISCNNGIEGLDYIKDCVSNGSVLPEIILLDANMPMMDATQFLDELLVNHKCLINKTKIFILSGFQNEEIENNFKSYPIEKILEKPLTEKLLKDILIPPV